jgi:hypothetical protein
VRKTDHVWSPISRYWPVALVVALAAASITAGSLRRADHAATARPPAGDGVAPALAAFAGVDPLSAPDCDRSTGRLKIPVVSAPNCVPLWQKGRDNGGATSTGVTAGEIRVAVYRARVVPTIRAAQEAAIGHRLPTAAEDDRNRKQSLKVMNNLWETFGRTVRLVTLPASGADDDEVAARADAIRAALELKVFAVIGGPVGTKAFASELAARGVLCVCTDSLPAESLDRWAPYVWGVGLSSTQRYELVTELVAKLDGKPAEYAGGNLTRSKRKFALVYVDTTDQAQRTGGAYLEKLLRRAGVDLAMTISYVFDLSSLQENAGTMVARMKQGGVTSIIFAGEPWMPYYLGVQATSEAWFPEWVLAGTGYTDLTISGRRYDQRQWRHAFGISSQTAPLTPAAQERAGNFLSWYLGAKLSSYPNLTELTTLFTGIQLAGPHLTPETFRDGLFSYLPTRHQVTSVATSWGKHDRSGDPDYTAAHDATLVWWDADAVGPHELQSDGQTGRGMYRYVDGGRRYLPGELRSARPRFFDPAGTVLLLADRPPADGTPSYPRRSSRSG